MLANSGNNKEEEVFRLELEGWYYGVEHYPGEIYPELIHRLLKELKPSFLRAIRKQVVFDIADIGARFCKAAKYLVPQKEIVFSILVNLPSPAGLNEEQMYTLAKVIDKVEKIYPGVIERLQKRWKRPSNSSDTLD